MLLADNHFTPVIGIDIHFTTLPPYNPFHPFIGLVLDPMDYIPFIGATVHVNGLKRGVSDTQGIIIPLAHFPLFTGPFAFTPIIGNESMNFFACEKVYADGMRMSPKGNVVMTCNDIGIPLSIEPGKKKFWKLVPTLFAPTSCSIPLPTGAPVHVGGPYVPDWGGMLTGLAMSFGFGAIMRGVGKGLTKLNHKVLKKGGKNSRKVGDLLCQLGFEPVNLVTGSVIYTGTDFTLPGPIPLEWKRSWESSNDYSGVLGHGCQSNYDLDIEIIPEEEAVAVRLQDGRLLAFPLIEDGEQAYSRQEKLTLRRERDCFEVFHHDTRLSYYYQEKQTENRYRLSRIENTSQLCIRLTYHHGLLSELTDSSGRILALDYTIQKRIARVRLVSHGKHVSDHILVEYGYNGEGDMIQIVDSLGKSTRIDYRNHLMVKKTDRQEHSFYWEYESGGTKARCVHTWGDGGWQEGWLEYHKEEGYNLVRECTGSITTYYYTPQEVVTRIKDPLGNEKRFEYTEHNELYREWDEEGHMKGYTYDKRGNRTSVVYPDGNREQFMYDDQDRLVMSINAEGDSRQYVYQSEKGEDTEKNRLHPKPDKGKGLLSAVIEADNSITRFEYNTCGLPVEVRKNGESLFLDYDSRHNLITLTNSSGALTRWKYDFRGNVIATINPAGEVQSFIYDRLNRVTGINSDGVQTRFTYNAYEEILSIQSGKRDIHFTYTPLGSVESREENGHRVRFSYDQMERLRVLTNEHQERYLFSRNSRGDVTSETGFDDVRREYLRDRTGKVAKVLRPGGCWTAYEYDLNGRIIRADYHDGTWETYGYNRNGQIIEGRTPTGCVKFARDRMGRIITETYGSGIPTDEGIIIRSEYDKNGNRVRLTSTLGADITQTFDRLGNLEEVEALNEQSEKVWQAKTKYNSLGQEIEKTLTGGVKITRGYDEFGRPSKLVVNDVYSSRRESYHRRYYWNAGDRLISVLNGITNGQVTYSYDAIGNLSGAQYEDNSYDYRMPDALGNVYRKKDRSDREYGKGGQLLRDEKFNYFYDEQGNLTLKSKRQGIATLSHAPYNHWLLDEDPDYRLPPKEYTREEESLIRRQWDTEWQHPQWHPGDYAYAWQGNGMLKSVVTPEGRILSFEYDAFGRRTSKVCDDKIKRYLWDGNVLLHEWSYELKQKPAIVTDELGTRRLDRPEPTPDVITWVYEGGNFVPSGKIVNNKSYSIVSDYIGKPVQAYDEEGTIVWQTDYDVYGQLKNLKGEREFIPFRYQGQYEDGETGLYYNRFRYYDSSTGTYLSQDPIGLAGNNPTLYAYVKDTNTWVDIWGLLILYHAGDLQSKIDLTQGRQDLDFNPTGKGGFYTTADLSQAQKWAEKKGGNITVFDIPDEKLAALKTKTFDAPTDEWADFVTKGRAGTLSHNFDAVSGPMLANPRGKAPKAIGSQFAIFSDEATSLFDEHKVGSISCH